MSETAVRWTSASELFGPGMLEDPYPVYRAMREADPVMWHEEFNAWLVTGYDAVLRAVRDLRLSNERAEHMRSLVDDENLRSFFGFINDRMVFTDPPRHTRLRELVSKSFTPAAIEALRGRVQELVDGFLEPVLSSGRMDVIGDLAFPLPSTVIGEMLGLPAGDWRRIKQWSDDFLVFVQGDPGRVEPALYDRATRSLQEMTGYFRDVLADMRRHPRPCLLADLLAAQDANRMSEDEVLANANMLLVAGHETTTNLIGNGLLALLRHRDVFEALRANPQGIAQAVEEFLRYDSPLQFTHRVAKEDFVLGDKTIGKGDFVYLMLGAANRDPAHFKDPDRLDVTRSPNKHVAFGVGWHSCIGAPLARLEAHVTFSTLLRRMPGLRLQGGPLEHADNFNLRGLKSLPVRF